jgi:hypothetical protein
MMAALRRIAPRLFRIMALLLFLGTPIIGVAAIGVGGLELDDPMSFSLAYAPFVLAAMLLLVWLILDSAADR